MAGTLIRVTDFAPATPILSAEVDAELNQIVNLLNGTTSNVKAVFKVSDAGDPPIEVNQLSTGPIQEWFQGGILKASVSNDGSIVTTGGISINNANPAIVFDDTAGTDAKIDLDASVLRFGSTGANQFTLDVGTGIVSFTQIPVGPASDPTTDSQFARKRYVDDKSYWSASWLIADPSTFPLASFNLSQKALVPKGNYRALTLHGIFATGSASGSFSFELRKHPFNNQASETVLGTITFNSGTLGVGVDVDIADHEFTEKDWLYLALTARSSPLQRDVSISVIGDKLGSF